MHTSPLTHDLKTHWQNNPFLGSDISEFSFANAFAFRHVHNYALIQEDNLSCLSGRHYTGETYLLPLQDPQKKAYLEFILKLAQNHDMLYPLPPSWRPWAEAQGWHIWQRAEDADYIYTTETLAEMAGRKLHKKRNQIKQCRSLYHIQSQDFIQVPKEKILSILDHWQEGMDLGWNETDYLPCKEASLNATDLNLTGLVFFADESPAGFVLGEPLNDQTFVVHFAKARKAYKGIYALMFQSLAQSLADSYSFINLEQDLGNPALRQSKESYQPKEKRSKLRASFR
jgi:hypothetical protein